MGDPRLGAPMSVDERFTHLADKATETLGKWPITVLCACLILVWLASGPLFSFSDSWQLAINTPTTIVELFQGLFALAATNRLEARNRALFVDLQATARQHKVMLDALQALVTEVRTQAAIVGSDVVHIAAKEDEILGLWIK